MSDTGHVDKPEDNSIRLSKDELIQRGILPPEKKKSLREAVEKENAVPQERAETMPKGLVQNQQDEIFKRHSQRGSLAMEFIKTILSKEGANADPEGVVSLGFAIADELQEEIDTRYRAELLEKQLEAAGYTKVSARKED